MDIEELLAILKLYKPHELAKATGLCQITVYNILSRKQKKPKKDSIEKLHKFLVSQQVAIACLEVHQL